MLVVDMFSSAFTERLLISQVVSSFAKRSKVPEDFHYLEPEEGEAPLNDQDPKPTVHELIQCYCV